MRQSGWPAWGGQPLNAQRAPTASAAPTMREGATRSERHSRARWLNSRGGGRKEVAREPLVGCGSPVVPNYRPSRSALFSRAVG